MSTVLVSQTSIVRLPVYVCVVPVHVCAFVICVGVVYVSVNVCLCVRAYVRACDSLSRMRVLPACACVYVTTFLGRL